MILIGAAYATAPKSSIEFHLKVDAVVNPWSLRVVKCRRRSALNLTWGVGGHTCRCWAYCSVLFQLGGSAKQRGLDTRAYSLESLRGFFRMIWRARWKVRQGTQETVACCYLERFFGCQSCRAKDGGHGSAPGSLMFSEHGRRAICNTTWGVGGHACGTLDITRFHSRLRKCRASRFVVSSQLRHSGWEDDKSEFAPTVLKQGRTLI